MYTLLARRHATSAGELLVPDTADCHKEKKRADAKYFGPTKTETPCLSSYE